MQHVLQRAGEAHTAQDGPVSLMTFKHPTIHSHKRKKKKKDYAYLFFISAQHIFYKFNFH